MFSALGINCCVKLILLANREKKIKLGIVVPSPKNLSLVDCKLIDKGLRHSNS